MSCARRKKNRLIIVAIAVIGVLLSCFVQGILNKSAINERVKEFESQISSLTLLMTDRVRHVIDQASSLAKVLEIGDKDRSQIKSYFSSNGENVFSKFSAVHSVFLLGFDKDTELFSIKSRMRLQASPSNDAERIAYSVLQRINDSPELSPTAKNNVAQKVFFLDSSKGLVNMCVTTVSKFSQNQDSGLLLTCSSFSDIVDPVLNRSSNDLLGIQVFSRSEQGQYKQLYFFGVASPSDPDFSPVTDIKEGSVFLPGAIPMGSSALSVLFTPEGRYVTQLGWQHYVPMILSIIVTLVVCLYFESLARKNDQIMDVVERKDRELVQATRDLETQIEERTKLYEEVHKYSEQLSSLINSIDGILWEADPTTLAVTYISDQVQQMMGYSPQEYMSGKRLVNDISVTEDGKTYAELLLENMSGKESFKIEYNSRRADGSSIWVRNVITKIFEGEKLHLIRGVLIDITTEKEQQIKSSQIETQLRQSQKLEAIGQLAAGIAHEINTPSQFVGDNINFMNSSLEDMFTLITDVQEANATSGEPNANISKLLDDSDFEYLKAEIPEAIAQSLEGISRVNTIVNAMKDFSHPGSTEMQRIDLKKAIISTVVIAKNEWTYVAELETEFADSMPLINCFPGELNQTILNIVVNAAHAIEERFGGNQMGKIDISTSFDHEYLTILISDNGCGIEQEVIDKVFDPFFTTKVVGKGTGQGLAIAYSVVVEMHKGKMSVTSKRGLGTQFTICLPLTAEDDKLE